MKYLRAINEAFKSLLRGLSLSAQVGAHFGIGLKLKEFNMVRCEILGKA